ncbi:MAG: hypothetical protein ORO03_07210, partial [Alphaproteobacteria bacterium]|nr:hypothetical protein [Alphaproteobacteria bacterium]
IGLQQTILIRVKILYWCVAQNVKKFGLLRGLTAMVFALLRLWCGAKFRGDGKTCEFSGKQRIEMIGCTDIYSFVIEGESCLDLL